MQDYLCAKNGAVLGSKARNDNACITGNPLIRSGGFKKIVFGSWATEDKAMIAKDKIARVFFIVKSFPF